LRPTQPPIQ